MKHKYLILARISIVLFVFGIAGYSYAQKTEWAMGMGGKSTVSGKLVTTGPNGDIYVAGAFKDTIDADPGPSETFLYSAGGYDIYILKLKSYGMLEWAYRLGGALDDHVKGLDVDQNGNIYLTGYFQGTSDFEPGAGTYVLNSGTGTDIFVLKLNQAVVLQWAVNMGGESSAYANDIVVDETGESYLTGFFYDTVDFDPGVNSEKHGSIGNGDIFVLNLDANGGFDWVKTFGGVGHDQGNAITLDTNSTYGYSLVTGCFSDSVAFPMNAQSAGESDVFISKLGNLTGQYIWNKTMGSVGNDRGKSIQADKDGNVYTTGYYSDNIDMDPGSNTTTLNSYGNNDIFVQKLNASGYFQWAEGIGGTGHDVANSMVVPGVDTLYLGGYLNDTVIFDPGINEIKLYAGSQDAFIAFFIQNDIQWARNYGSEWSDNLHSIAVNNSSVYATGDFWGTADLNPGPGTLEITSQGSMDAFLFKSVPCTYDTINVATSSCDHYAIDGSVYDSTGTYVHHYVNRFGCDSTVFLDLTIHGSSETILHDTVCDQYAFNGRILDTSGQYVDSLTNLYGCDSIVTLNLTVNNQSVPVLFGVDSNTLTIDVADVEYYWADCNNGYALIDSVSDGTHQSFTPGVNGSYAAIISKAECMDTSDCLNFVVEALHTAKKQDIRVFPNPTKGLVYVDLDKSYATVKAEISAGSGEMVSTHVFENTGQFNIDLQEQPAGVYYLKLSLDKEAIVKYKLIKNTN